MSAPRHLPNGLDLVEPSPVAGLAVFEHRVDDARVTVICVHGGLDRGGSFARLARRLTRDDLVTYDRRGYQGSRDLRPLGLGPDVEDLVSLIDAEPGRPVILLGHSFGGVVTLGAALARPNRVAGLLCFETPLPWVLNRHSNHPPLTEDTASEAERFFRRMVGNSAWERLSDAERESRWRDGDGLVTDLKAIRGTPSSPYDERILTVPMIYAYGDRHATEYYDELTALLHQRNPLITGRLLPGAPHGAHLASPDQLANLLDELVGMTCASA